MSPLSTRASGILLHPTSLAGPFAHGDLGPCAREFVDFLHQAKQRWWQMLPIHPTGGGDSPYDSPSAFAGSPYLVSLEDLVEVGLLEQGELPEAAPLAAGQPDEARFALGRDARVPLLRRAHQRFIQPGSDSLKIAHEEFLQLNNSWVWDFGLYAALKQVNQLRSWVDWDPELRARSPEALEAAHRNLKDEVRFEVFCQFLFHYQWGKLRDYARSKNVSLMGDIPMFVSHDSADVWANQGMFFLGNDGARLVQAGVPPDYFSEDGQLWGNPLYRWDAMRGDDYGWWIDRLRRELHKFDAVRIDHFIALCRYWEVPMGAENARGGKYVPVDGAHFLSRVSHHLGGLPYVAEDLGVLTQEVADLRDHFALPGMRILQFAFSEGAETYLPHRHPKRSVAYLGTHDNDTTRGWYENLQTVASAGGPSAAQARSQLKRIYAYSGVSDPSQVNRALIRLGMASQADTVILTIQDLLDQDSRSRMNVPGVGSGNWAYRMNPGSLTDPLADELCDITLVTERASLENPLS